MNLVSVIILSPAWAWLENQNKISTDHMVLGATLFFLGEIYILLEVFSTRGK